MKSKIVLDFNCGFSVCQDFYFHIYKMGVFDQMIVHVSICSNTIMSEARQHFSLLSKKMLFRYVLSSLKLHFTEWIFTEHALWVIIILCARETAVNKTHIFPCSLGK